MLLSTQPKPQTAGIAAILFPFIADELRLQFEIIRRKTDRLDIN